MVPMETQHSQIGEHTFITQPQVADKAVSYVVEGRVTILDHDDFHIWGSVQGSKPYPYKVYWKKGVDPKFIHSAGSCSCAATTTCSHILAVLLLATTQATTQFTQCKGLINA